MDDAKPRDWGQAFAALPLETPPPEVWAKVSARLSGETPRRPRALRWPALAAAVLLVLLMPLWWAKFQTGDARREADSRAVLPSASPHGDAASELVALQNRSAQLEALLAQVRDDRVASGPASAFFDALDERVAVIDAALSEPELPPQADLSLWRERVSTLQQLVAFESGQRLLAAHGERYDGHLVAVD